MQPDPTLEQEDVLAMLTGLPEHVADLVSGLDAPALAYRHGPAFPTLEEVLSHLAQTSHEFDGVIRRAYLEHVREVDVRAALDVPYGPGAGEAREEVLQTYSRIRRRTVDLLRGLSEADFGMALDDRSLGEISLLDACRLVVMHETGHLGQVRNLVSLLPEPQDLGPVPSS